MKKTRIALFGATGRMGEEIQALAKQSKDLEVTVRVSRSKSDKLDAKKVDVVVDVTSPEGFEDALEWAIENRKAFVSGTTGLSEKQKQMVKKAGKSIPTLWSPNMSLGIAMMQNALASLGACKDFEVVIEETHHKHKKDKPSGTALLLQQTVEESMKRKIETPLSIRGGGVFGIHKIHMLGEEETLCFEHQALNRTVFARGALTAAKWIAGRKAGTYLMKDVLDQNAK